MIYLDLDNTLIHSLFGYRPSKHRKYLRLDDEGYSVAVRPTAYKILATLRKLDSVKMLTVATGDYARLMNNSFNFGFKDEEIISRDEFLVYIDGENLIREQLKDKTGILVDDKNCYDGWTNLKRLYIGTERERVFQIRCFEGRDPEIFEKDGGELDKMLERIKNFYK